MALIKRDILNPNKMEVVTIEQALDETMRIAALGYETTAERTTCENEELKHIVGRLLKTLSDKMVLSEDGINQVLNCYTITVGQPYDPK